MNDGNFSESLSRIMKEKRITGVQLAKEIDVSPKTISRYVRAEVIPTVEMQNRILAALEKLGEDSGTERYKQQLNMRELTEKYGAVFRDAEEILNDELAELEADKRSALRVFMLLEPANRKFVLENFDAYAGIEAHEIALLEMFSLMNEKEKQYIIRELENYRVVLKDFKENKTACRKIAQYMRMIAECDMVIKEKQDKFSDPANQKVDSEDGEYRQYSELLERKSGIAVELLGTYLPMLLTMDALDWYLLMLVQYVVLRDRGVNTTYNGRIIGNKLMLLMEYMEEKVAENNKR